MAENKTCPRCGQPLRGDALEGLCPECLLQVGLATETIPPDLPTETLPPGLPTESMGLIDEISPLLKAGESLGHYRILRRLGHGGMGVVYEAEETDSGRRVALKILRRQLDTPQDRARFLREGRVAASINHPHCVYVFGTEEVDGTPTISMEYIAGTTLAQRLHREGPLPVGQAVDAMLQVIDGLAAAQSVGILHRDIKPSNCFQDSDGRIKIGDFGLSISTLARAETVITEAGTMLGTPAFCSPEQLRGEELGMRSDMYAVGATLFQLLTGRIPFEGKTMPQLIANILEKRAPSPKRFRPDIPAGLARVILRCLEKQSSDRFRSYADLRRVLEPYGSAAPQPATLGLRFGAGLTDMMLLGGVGHVVMLLIYKDPFVLLDRMTGDMSSAWKFVLPWFLIAILYYALCEWRAGATPGKALFRLRVVRPDRAYPRLWQALVRAVSFLVIPVLPYWMVAAVRSEMLLGASAATYALSLTYYILLVVMFSTARRRNGFAAMQDLLSRTRIISRTALAARTAQPMTVEDPPVADAAGSRIGPYHVLQPLDAQGGVAWFEGYDMRLLRRVLIRTVPPGTPHLATAQRTLAQVGRLRWLTGRREEEEHWDAFEGVGGQSLSRVARQPQPWSRVRYWLTDLAEELQAIDRGASPPVVLDLDRVWITDTGRAKIFDFPVPGQLAGETVPACPEPSPQAFLDRVAAVALAGDMSAGPAAEVARPMPAYARAFLVKLPVLTALEITVNTLRNQMRRPASVTRLRRGIAVACCLAFPLVACVGMLLGSQLLTGWQSEYPDFMEMNQVLQTWKAKQYPFVPDDALPSDRQFGIYIASHYREVISDEAVWSGGLARSLFSGKARAFAEESMLKYADVSAGEIAAADEALDPIVPSQVNLALPPPPKMAIMAFSTTLMMYVSLPAILLALLCRGGLVLLATSITFVRCNGKRASRLRLLWRALVAWIPVFVATTVGLVSTQLHWSAPMAIIIAAVIVLAVCSLLLPNRGLPDRLAGTCPVPR